MKQQYITGYALGLVLAAWSVYQQNYEFMLYAAAVFAFLGIIQWTDSKYHYSSTSLWLVVLWIVLHILGGLWVVDGQVLYSKVLIPIVGEPYNILKYDQVVHAFCYFTVTLLMWRVVTSISKPSASRAELLFVTVLAATAIGGVNEIIEFIATVTVPDTNVGGYENTAIDIISNLVGALLATPLLKNT